MLVLQTRPGKVVVITLLSLLAAVICFWLLSSSAVVDNGVAELGGAFAGFIVTVLTLNRVWGQEGELEAQAAKAGSEFTYQEVVKTLDLRQASPLSKQQVAPLTDYYRVKRLGEAQVLHLHYATTSDGIEWRGSATHPGTAQWHPVGVSHVGPRGEVLKHEYRVDVNLGDLARGETTPLITNVAYRNGFKKLESEWLETHLEQPAGRLTMIVLSPDDMRVTSAEAGRTLARGELEPVNERPTVMHDGSIIYWSIDDPLLSARYALSWTWSRRSLKPIVADEKPSLGTALPQG